MPESENLDFQIIYIVCICTMHLLRTSNISSISEYAHLKTAGANQMFKAALLLSCEHLETSIRKEY
uniref:Uncharacterized protein n=1 Tax=Arundo donax TaxID=35708 RepID=A0A0A9EKD1_ARUDO